MKNWRKGNIEIISNTRQELDIFCWEKCPYFGKLDEHIANGWEANENFLQSPPPHQYSVDLKFFNKEELKYLICTYSNEKFEFLGDRVLNLSYEDMKDFIWQMRSITKLKSL